MPADGKLIMAHADGACSSYSGHGASVPLLICGGKARKLVRFRSEASNSGVPLNECVNRLARRGLDDGRASVWLTTIGEVS